MLSSPKKNNIVPEPGPCLEIPALLTLSKEPSVSVLGVLIDNTEVRAVTGAASRLSS